MLTRWGRDLDPENPLPEYPRPQLVRDNWVNLNGRWDIAFTKVDEKPTYEATIVVPFSPEAPLSGVNRQLQPDEWLWYRLKDVRVPTPPPNGRVLLHFGAVDQSCVVWVNGAEAGDHVGGYLPFSLDITDHVTGSGETIEVRVRDLSETGPHARGKQRLDRGTIWYTAQSGIWQTVWLEAVPERYVESLQPGPGYGGGRAEGAGLDWLDHHGLDTNTLGSNNRHDATVVVRAGDRVVGQATGPANATSGSPCRRRSTPGRLRIRSSTTWRSSSARTGSRRTPPCARSVSPRIAGSPSTERRTPTLGVLDQGYWPDGLLTPPSDQAMIHDIETMKSLGFTMLRKHVKIEPLRWYHHCDRLGILVWQDMVNGGGRYRHLVANLPATRPIRISDKRYSLFFRDDAVARAEFRAEVRETVRLLSNVAAIVVWTPFNEGWGQFDANAIAAEVQELDPTRLVNHVSGWIDQGGGDIRSFHSYLKAFRLPRRRGEKRVLALTEYGGYSLQVAGHDWSSREYGYRHFDNAPALSEAFIELHRSRIAPAVKAGLSATVYTQLSDVEDELNGLLTWDREVLKIPVDTIRETLAELSAAVDPA